MKLALTVITGVAIIASVAQARIGETVATCTARYGEPKTVKLDQNQTGVAIYDKNDLGIKLHFTADHADLVRYTPGEVAQIDLDTARFLIEANGRDKKWEQLTETEETMWSNEDERRQRPRIRKIDPVLWETKDGLLVASYSPSRGSLEIKASSMQLKIRDGL